MTSSYVVKNWDIRLLSFIYGPGNRPIPHSLSLAIKVCSLFRLIEYLTYVFIRWTFMAFLDLLLRNVESIHTLSLPEALELQLYICQWEELRLFGTYLSVKNQIYRLSSLLYRPTPFHIHDIILDFGWMDRVFTVYENYDATRTTLPSQIKIEANFQLHKYKYRRHLSLSLKRWLKPFQELFIHSTSYNNPPHNSSYS